jgi:hypothetical protein
MCKNNVDSTLQGVFQHLGSSGLQKRVEGQEQRHMHVAFQCVYDSVAKGQGCM